MSNIATIKMKLNVLFSGLVLTTMLAACGNGAESTAQEEDVETALPQEEAQVTVMTVKR